MQKARIKLASTETDTLEEVCEEIKDIAKKVGTDISGPIPLPTKDLKINTYRTPCGSGTGGHKRSATYDKYQMKIHKRILDIGANDRALRQIMRVQVPEEVSIEIEMME